MSETVGSNLRLRGTLVVVGATTLAILIASTVTGTVGKFTTSVSTPILSGSTLKLGGGTTTITGSQANGWALGTSGTLTGATLSGATLNAAGGDIVMNKNGIRASTATTAIEMNSISGATIRSYILSGSALYVPGSASCIFCRTTAGTIGCVTRTATGTLATGTCT